MSDRAGRRDWEAAVVGGGPAGLAAGLQLARAGWRTVLIERAAAGGQARRIETLENIPGWPCGVSGRDLMSSWERQARGWGLQSLKGELADIGGRPGMFDVRLKDGRRLRARTVLLATGARFKKLAVPGERHLFGRGVFHAAFDEAPRWRGRDVAVIGGGEAAVHQAVHLARWARRVVLVARGPLRAHRLLSTRLAACPNAEIVSARATRIIGRRGVEALLLRGGDGRTRRLPVSAVFVLVGAEASPWAGRARTPGVFVAGDARGKTERQVLVAAGDGMAAAVRAARWMQARS